MNAQCSGDRTVCVEPAVRADTHMRERYLPAKW